MDLLRRNGLSRLLERLRGPARSRIGRRFGWRRSTRKCAFHVLIGALVLTNLVPQAILPRLQAQEYLERPNILDSTGTSRVDPSLGDVPLETGAAPHTIRKIPKDIKEEPQYWDMSLDEAICLGLEHSRVFRDLGGTILRAPESMQTKYNPALAESDPRFGVEAALSDYDARFAMLGNFEKNDRYLNNEFLGGGTRAFTQDLHTYQSQLSKTTATGTEFAVRNFTDYNNNNAPANQFPSAWNSNYEVEVRQPLLQGSGLDFNRIAGPKSVPGLINGVKVARTNVEISQAEFESGLRDFVSNVINAYWDLYYAYRDLDVKIEARDAALALWQKESERKGQGQAAEAAIQAEEQYFRLEEDVQNSLSGKQFEGTRTNNGSSGGMFRGTGGVQLTERRLRLILGIPISGSKLIRPSDEPSLAEFVLDWHACLDEARQRRPELKRQRLRIQKREMELIASRNFTQPRLDVSGRYRWRGFGHDLAGGQSDDFSSAYSVLGSGRNQEWQMGVEFEVPLGLRRGHAAVHNAELQLARETALLVEQERQIIHDLAATVAEMDRAYAICKTALNRYQAADKLIKILQRRLDSGNAPEKRSELKVPPEKYFEAQRRLADAKSRYFLTRVEYVVAVKNVEHEKGSLLDMYHILIDDSKKLPQASTARRSPAAAVEELVPPLPLEISDPRSTAGKASARSTADSAPLPSDKEPGAIQDTQGKVPSNRGSATIVPLSGSSPVKSSNLPIPKKRQFFGGSASVRSAVDADNLKE